MGETKFRFPLNHIEILKSSKHISSNSLFYKLYSPRPLKMANHHVMLFFSLQRTWIITIVSGVRRVESFCRHWDLFGIIGHFSFRENFAKFEVFALFTVIQPTDLTCWGKPLSHLSFVKHSWKTRLPSQWITPLVTWTVYEIFCQRRSIFLMVIN
jgi:hypothetical protein